MRYLAFLVTAATALAAVDGVVLNGTTGKPQPGATVTFYKLGGAGMESLESVRSDAQGKFVLNQTPQGPNLIQAAWDGVTYNLQLPPGSPTSNLQIQVYSSSKQPGKARVAQHLVLLEPSGGQLGVRESFIFNNDGATTYNDPDGGTLRFYVPDAAKTTTSVQCTAPQGMPIQRAAEKAGPADVYKVDFPIKPGETRIDVSYAMPFESPGAFSSKVFYKGGPTRLFVPTGVTLSGDNVKSLGQEPSTQLGVYETAEAAYKVDVTGSGTMPTAGGGGDENAGPGLQQILPRVYDRLEWILASAFAALTLGFILLYRKQAPKGSARG